MRRHDSDQRSRTALGLRKQTQDHVATKHFATDTTQGSRMQSRHGSEAFELQSKLKKDNTSLVASRFQ